VINDNIAHGKVLTNPMNFSLETLVTNDYVPLAEFLL
jgi:hypothetical protein